MRTIKTSFPIFLAVLFLPVAALPAQAVTRTWPGTTAPCNTTLQNCINGAAEFDRIEIATNTLIDEEIDLIAKSRVVVAANGYRPRLADSRSIYIGSSLTTASRTVLVDGLTLRGGLVTVDYRGIGTANYTIRNMVLEAGSSGARSFISVNAEYATMNLQLYNNTIHCSPDAIVPSVIGIASKSSAILHADVSHNTIACSNQNGVVKYGILAEVGNSSTGSASANLKFHANEFRAEPYTGSGTAAATMHGIGILESFDTAQPSTIVADVFNNVLIGNGLASSINALIVQVKYGDMTLQAFNNTMTGWQRSLSAGSYFSPGSGTQNIQGFVANNVMVSSGPAFYLQPTTTAALSNRYNLVNAPAIGTTLGSNSITAPASLVSDAMPRLRAGSPAVDAADTSVILNYFNSMPTTDADGLRRIKGTGGTVDMGAYEFGDVTFDHRVTGTGSDISRIYSVALDGNASALPQASLLDLPGAINYYGPYGVDYATGNWRLFDEAFASLPLGSGFNIFAPASGNGLLRHIATPASTDLNYTRIDNVGLNDRPGLIVLATQNLNPNAVYNPHPISVAYVADSWFVDNNDLAPMPINAAFNLYWQQPSPNAFRVTASAANLVFGGLRVNHRLLDGNPCARPQATRMTLESSSRSLSATWEYSAVRGDWRLYDDGFITPIPVGTQFNVLVDPAQVALCTDRIFDGGF